MLFPVTSINIHTITDDASYSPYGISRLVLYAINVYVIIIAYYKARYVLKDGVVGFRSYCSAGQIRYCVVSLVTLLLPGVFVDVERCSACCPIYAQDS